MKKKSEVMQIAELQFKRDCLAMAVDLLRHPIVSMIAGVSAVNLLSRIRDEKDNPVLFSDEIRWLLQTAAMAYPAAAGILGIRDTATKFSGYAAAGAAGGAAAQAVTAARIGARSAAKFAPILIPQQVIDSVFGGSRLINSSTGEA